MAANEVVRELRATGGLSQRALAELAGTSGPTVAAYESGSKEPLFSTMERLAAAVGMEVKILPRTSDAQRRRRPQRSLALAAATAAAVEREFATAVDVASTNLSRMRDVVGSNASQKWLDEWEASIDEGPARVREILLDPSEHGDDMRQMSPFAGLLSNDARDAVLAATKALE